MYLEVTSGAVLRRPRMARNARIPHKLPSAHELHSLTFGSEATVRLPPGGGSAVGGGGERVQTIYAQNPVFE